MESGGQMASGMSIEVSQQNGSANFGVNHLYPRVNSTVMEMVSQQILGKWYTGGFHRLIYWRVRVVGVEWLEFLRVGNSHKSNPLNRQLTSPPFKAEKASIPILHRLPPILWKIPYTPPVIARPSHIRPDQWLSQSSMTGEPVEEIPPKRWKLEVPIPHKKGHERPMFQGISSQFFWHEK